MAIAPGERTQVRNDRRHAPGQLIDQFEVAARIVDALMIEQHFGVFGIAADGRQRLVEFVADAGRHGAQRGQLARLYQVILGAHQFLLGMLALQHFFAQALVEAFKVAGSFGHPAFEFTPGLGFEGDAFQIMTAALHHQADQQHDYQQGGRANGQHGPHRAIDQGTRRKNIYAPAGLVDFLRLYYPRIGVDVQRLQVARRVGQDGENVLLLLRRQFARGLETPIRAGRENHHAVVVGRQQLLRGVAPQALGVIQVYLDHQYAELFIAFGHRGGKVIAALAGRSAQAEKAPQLAVHCFAEVRTKSKVASDKAVGLVPVRRRHCVAIGINQVHDLGAGLAVDLREQLIGRAQGVRVFRVGQRITQRGQFAQNLWQHLITVQRAQQVGHVQVEGLAVLPGQFAAVIALGQVLQRPQQRRQAQRQ